MHTAVASAPAGRDIGGSGSSSVYSTILRHLSLMRAIVIARFQAEYVTVVNLGIPLYSVASDTVVLEMQCSIEPGLITCCN